MIDACAGEGRDSLVVASPCGTSEIEMDETGSPVMYDAARTEEVGTRGPLQGQRMLCRGRSPMSRWVPMEAS